jgi:anti-sigma B factor antagonist
LRRSCAIPSYHSEVRELNVIDTDFEITETVDDRSHVLSVRGEVDLSTAPALSRKLVDTGLAPTGVVVVDLSAVSFLDSTGLGALVTGEERIRDQGGQLRLVVTAPNVLKVFEITGLALTFSIHPTIAEALNI